MNDARRPDAHDRACPEGCSRAIPSTTRSTEARAARRGPQTARERHGTAGRAPAQVPPRDALELRDLDRHRGPPGRDPLRVCRLDEYLQREIFEPLGMVDTGFFVPEADRCPRLAACYQYRPANTPQLMEGPFANAIRAPPFLSLRSGRAGLDHRTTTCAFCQMLANGGPARRPAGARPQDPGSHDGQPPARREPPCRTWPSGASARPTSRASASGSVSPSGWAPPPRPWRDRAASSSGAVRPHHVLGRPGRGPLRRLHDPALPLRGLPVPGPAAAHSSTRPSTIDGRGWRANPSAQQRHRRPPLRRPRHLRRLPGRPGGRLGHRGGRRPLRRAAPATGPVPGCARPPCAKALASYGPTTQRSRPSPSSWPRWSTPVTSPAHLTTRRRR